MTNEINMIFVVIALAAANVVAAFIVCLFYVIYTFCNKKQQQYNMYFALPHYQRIAPIKDI